MNYEWTFNKPDLFNNTDMDTVRYLADAAVAWLEEYGNSPWRDPRYDDKVNDMEPFLELTDSQIDILRELISNDDIRVVIEPLLYDKGGITGDYQALSFFCPIVSAVMRESRIHRPVIFDCLSENLDSGQVIVVGPLGWVSVGTDEMINKPFGAMLDAIATVSGDETAFNMISCEMDNFQNKMGHGPDSNNNINCYWRP